MRARGTITSHPIHPVWRALSVLALILVASTPSGPAAAHPDPGGLGQADIPKVLDTHRDHANGHLRGAFAFLARADDPVDALAASAVAGRLDAPVLVSFPDALSDAAERALRHADPQIVILAGGTEALSDEVADAVAAALPDAHVRRVSGPTRTHTAEELAKLIDEFDPSWLRAHPELAEVNVATAAYQDVDAAQADGWDLLFQPDPDDPASACFENPGVGGMGVHYVKPDLLDDGLDPTRPEALVYEVIPDGLELVALEYVVPADAWDGEEPPEIFGRYLHLNEQLGLWTLHAWAWKDNPDGMFADFNPKVRLCDHWGAMFP